MNSELIISQVGSGFIYPMVRISWAGPGVVGQAQHGRVPLAGTAPPPGKVVGFEISDIFLFKKETKCGHFLFCLGITDLSPIVISCLLGMAIGVCTSS